MGTAASGGGTVWVGVAASGVEAGVAKVGAGGWEGRQWEDRHRHKWGEAPTNSAATSAYFVAAAVALAWSHRLGQGQGWG